MIPIHILARKGSARGLGPSGIVNKTATPISGVMAAMTYGAFSCANSIHRLALARGFWRCRSRSPGSMARKWRQMQRCGHSLPNLQHGRTAISVKQTAAYLGRVHRRMKKGRDRIAQTKAPQRRLTIAGLSKYGRHNLGGKVWRRVRNVTA
jgi:hypothetical protein